jgi:hypothetical protein
MPHGDSTPQRAASDIAAELLDDSAAYLDEYEEYDDDEGEAEPEEGGFIHWPRDPQLDPAMQVVREWFDAHPDEIFYGRQLEVILEKKYFHWITHKALKELTKDGTLQSELRTTNKGNLLRLYWSRRLRYSRRAAQRLAEKVDEHSDPDLSRAIGHHAENLFGFAAARAGFSIVGQNVRSYRGRIWPDTEHELDWILERDGVAGVWRSKIRGRISSDQKCSRRWTCAITWDSGHCSSCDGRPRATSTS